MEQERLCMNKFFTVGKHDINGDFHSDALILFITLYGVRRKRNTTVDGIEIPLKSRSLYSASGTPFEQLNNGSVQLIVIIVKPITKVKRSVRKTPWVDLYFYAFTIVL